MLKTVTVPEVGEVVLARRKGTRHLRLSISGGKVRLSVPFGVSEEIAMKFLKEKTAWIQKHQIEEIPLKNGDRIGRAHTLHLEPFETQKVSVRVNQQIIHVRYPRNFSPYDDSVQQAALRGCKRAMLAEAERLLPQRLETVSRNTGFRYKSCAIKFMKSRWGHCTNHSDITLSAYLIQLEWETIDYVLIHELAHTEQHNHGKGFWELVERHSPNYKLLRKSLKTQRTAVVPNAFVR